MGFLERLKFWKTAVAETPVVTPEPEPDWLAQAAVWIAEERDAACATLDAEERSPHVSDHQKGKHRATRIGIGLFAQQLLDRIAKAQK